MREVRIEIARVISVLSSNDTHDIVPPCTKPRHCSIRTEYVENLAINLTTSGAFLFNSEKN